MFVTSVFGVLHWCPN